VDGNSASRKNSSIISSSPSAIISTSFFMRFLGVVGQCGGNFFHRGLAVAIGLVNMGLHGHQINDAAESSFRADRQLKRDDVAPETCSSDSIERSKLESSRSIQVRTKHGECRIPCNNPRLFRSDLRPTCASTVMRAASAAISDAFVSVMKVE